MIVFSKTPFLIPPFSSAHRFADSVSGWYSGQARAPRLHSAGDKGQRVKGERLSDIWGQPPWQSSKAHSLRSRRSLHLGQSPGLDGQRWLSKRAQIRARPGPPSPADTPFFSFPFVSLSLGRERVFLPCRALPCTGLSTSQ